MPESLHILGLLHGADSPAAVRDTLAMLSEKIGARVATAVRQGDLGMLQRLHRTLGIPKDSVPRVARREMEAFTTLHRSLLQGAMRDVKQDQLSPQPQEQIVTLLYDSVQLSGDNGEEGKTLSAIARYMGLSRQKVSALLQKLISDERVMTEQPGRWPLYVLTGTEFLKMQEKRRQKQPKPARVRSPRRMGVIGGQPVHVYTFEKAKAG